jgi:predicted AAA+ superfamily ATPase
MTLTLVVFFVKNANLSVKRQQNDQPTKQAAQRRGGRRRRGAKLGFV